ncbi:MAG: chromosomal replication initiator protein DnaA [Caulobacterales bacterium]
MDTSEEGAPIARGGLAIWKQIKDILCARLGDALYRSWIEPLKIYSYDGKIQLIAPNAFSGDRVREQHLRMIQTLWNERDALAAEKGPIVIEVVTNDELSPDAIELLSEAAAEAAEQGRQVSNQAPSARVLEMPRGPSARMTFDDFVVGASNQLAVSAARGMAMGEGSARTLFLYGSHGSGKTHLAQAVWHLCLQKAPNCKVVYLSAEQFMSRFVAAVRPGGDMAAFKDLIRKADVLIIDDIHVIAREQRKGTQEEFFFTLNEFAIDGRMVVLTSALSPAELPELDARVRAKLAGGIVCSIAEPDFEHRCAIVAKKVKELAVASENFVMPQTLMEYVAGAVKGNGRVLEGAIAQIHLHADRGQRQLTLELIDKAIAETVGALQPIPRVDTIIRVIADDSGLTPDDLISACRKRPFVNARHIAQYFARKLSKKSFPDIARRFGGRDHATIMHGVSKIEARLEEDPTFARTLSALEKRIWDASSKH